MSDYDRVHQIIHYDSANSALHTLSACYVLCPAQVQSSHGGLCLPLITITVFISPDLLVFVRDQFPMSK